MVFVFGTICIDRVYRIADLPAIGGYSTIQSEESLLGGEAANTALALKSWGLEIALAGNQLGEGPSGLDLERLLAEKGLPTQYLEEGETITPICHVYVTPDGERTMFGLGFGEEGQHQDWDRLPFQKNAWFTADPNLGALAREAAARAAEHGMRLYLMDYVQETDTFPSGTFWQCSTDWIGVRGNTQKNVALVQSFVERHGCFAVLSDGPNGLVAGSPNHEVRAYPPYPCPKLVDSTGAGDMFRAGMIYGFENGWEIPQCLQFASAAGCLKCQYLGATTHVPSVDEIAGHVRKHKQVSRQYL